MDCFVRTRNDDKNEMAMEKQPAVYLMANKPNGTLYLGVTSDLVRRVAEHKAATFPGFSARHGCTRLVWFEQHATMEHAILREKQLKGGSRQAKITLIEAINPGWSDLYPNLA